jgi:hypothetical protein
MELPQGNSLVVTLISNKQKCHFFLFSSIKLENRGVEQVLTGAGGRGWYQWEGEVVGKWGRRVNTVQKKCVNVCKFKNDTW